MNKDFTNMLELLIIYCIIFFGLLINWVLFLIIIVTMLILWLIVLLIEKSEENNAEFGLLDRILAVLIFLWGLTFVMILEVLLK